MYKPGYYLFEGNLLEYYGDDEVFDIDSGEIYPVYILDVSEYKGGFEQCNPTYHDTDEI